jgi:hypothetical protein
MRYLIGILSILAITSISCGTITSIGSRFHSVQKSDGNQPKETRNIDTVTLKEDFDITPFKTKIMINDSIPPLILKGSRNLNAWYNYDSLSETTSTNKSLKPSAGFRVLVLTTDNFEEASSIKSDLYFKTDQKPVYITFEPPFYKVKAGDFLYSKEASEFAFKLNQMGFNETKIIPDTVNIVR